MSLTEVTHNGSGASQGMEIQLYFEHKPDDPVLVTVLMTMFFYDYVPDALLVFRSAGGYCAFLREGEGVTMRPFQT